MTKRALVSPALFALLAVAACGVAACGGPGDGLVAVGGKSFSQETLNDERNLEGQKKVLERLAAKPPALGPDVAVAVTGTAEISGVDLATGKTWSFAHPLDRRPQIAGPLVIGQGGGEIFALDAKTGQTKFTTRSPKGKLLGAGSDGTATVLVTRTAEGSALYTLGPDGSVRFGKTTEVGLARPAVAAGIVFVPWKNLYVTAFDATSGAQLATFVTDTETTHVVPFGGALFAGQGRLVRFDADLPKAKQGGSALAAPPQDLPNVTRRDLLVGPDHDDRIQADALDATPLTGRPTPSGAAGFLADRLYGGYYELVFGFDAKSAKLAWVHTGREEVVAAHAGKDGVVVVDKAGAVKLLAAANGAVTKSFSFGKPVLSADVLADGLSIGTGDAPPLAKQIEEAVTFKDDRLATGQIYLLETAAAVPDESTTAVLLQVADSERAAPLIKEAARKAIALRTNGAAAMIELLGRRADFLKGTRTPPVGPMAKALAAMKEKKAAGPLLAQLLDPALPQNDLVETAEGLAVLAEKEHLAQLQRFVNMYRGSSTGNLRLTDAIGAVATAIARIDGDKGREWLTNVAKDPLTDVDVRTTIQKVVEAATPKKTEPEGPADDGKANKKKKPVDDGPEPPGYKKRKEAEKAKEQGKTEKPKAGESKLEAEPPKAGVPTKD
jgi:outer membrane protein assembly factor BamB